MKLSTILLLLMIALVIFRGCSSVYSASQMNKWDLVYAEDFSDTSYQSNWHLDGFAEHAVAREADISYLEIRTYASSANPSNNQSVFWNKQRFDGDLHFRMRVRGQSDNRSILYFNARPTKESGLKSIFDWDKPDAQMDRYAADDRFETYDVELIRDTQERCYLSYRGGNTYKTFKMFRDPEINFGLDDYHHETELLIYPSPYKNMPDQWFVIDLRVVGQTISMWVDGKQIFEIVDPGNAGSNDYAWTPLTNGGWFGFRNFLPSTVNVDYIEVYRLKAN